MIYVCLYCDQLLLNNVADANLLKSTYRLMGIKNSKITPKREIDSGNEQKCEASPRVITALHEPPTAPVSQGPSISSLNLSSETYVKQKSGGPLIHLISPTKKASPTSVTHNADEDIKDHRDLSGRGKARSCYSVGDKILGNFEGNGEWFPGVICRAYDDLVYDIEYDDGDLEESVPASDIKLRARGPLTSSIPLQESNVSSPPLAAINTPTTTTTTTPSVTKSHKSSTIIQVQSSSPLLLPECDESNNENSSTPTGFGMNHTHSTSFKQLPPSGKKHGETKPSPKPVTVKQANADFDDYGEYDGSLDFVPRISSKHNVKANMYDDEDDEDDEFAALDEEDNQKSLTKSLLSGERSDSSAMIKNLYREDSKNTLLTPQYYEEKKAATQSEGDAVPPSTSGPSIVDTQLE